MQFKISTQANPPTSKYQVLQQCIKPAAQTGSLCLWRHLIRVPMGFWSCISHAVWFFEHSRKWNKKRLLGKQLLQTETGIWHKKGRGSGVLGRNVSSHSLLHDSQSSSALKLIWSWLCRRTAAALCINTSFQVDLHTPADPRMFLWNFSGIFTLSVFRPPVERLSWVWVCSVSQESSTAGAAWPNPAFFPGLNGEPWLPELESGWKCLCPWCRCAFLIYYFLSSLPADPFLLLRSYLPAPQLPTFHFSPSVPFFLPQVLTILSLKLPNWMT